MNRGRKVCKNVECGATGEIVDQTDFCSEECKTEHVCRVLALDTLSQKDRTFTLHWLDGKKETIRGYGTQMDALKAALTQAGYGNGAMRALDYWEEVR